MGWSMGSVGCTGDIGGIGAVGACSGGLRFVIDFIAWAAGGTRGRGTAIGGITVAIAWRATVAVAWRATVAAAWRATVTVCAASTHTAAIFIIGTCTSTSTAASTATAAAASTAAAATTTLAIHEILKGSLHRRWQLLRNLCLKS